VEVLRRGCESEGSGRYPSGAAKLPKSRHYDGGAARFRARAKILRSYKVVDEAIICATVEVVQTLLQVLEAEVCLL
jgi:hypothetical protein